MEDANFLSQNIGDWQHQLIKIKSISKSREKKRIIINANELQNH